MPYDFPIPRNRGYSIQNQDKQNCQNQELGKVETSCIRDLFLYVMFARVAGLDDSVTEFEAKFNPITNKVELIIPQDVLDKITTIEIQPRMRQYLDWLFDRQGVDDAILASPGRGLQMALGGALDSIGVLPLTNIGSELSAADAVLTSFRARRYIPGTSGTTTIQLEIDETPVPGAVLSWTPSDPIDSLKTINISENVLIGSRVSFRLISKEVGAVDVFAEVD